MPTLKQTAIHEDAGGFGLDEITRAGHFAARRAKDGYFHGWIFGFPKTILSDQAGWVAFTVASWVCPCCPHERGKASSFRHRRRAHPLHTAEQKNAESKFAPSCFKIPV